MSKEKVFIIGTIFLLALIMVASSCKTKSSSSVPETVKADPSFANDIQPIFTNNCALSGCHNSTAQQGLILGQGQAYSNLVDVSSTEEPNRIRVLPGDSANSYLVIKIEGNQTVGVRMPYGQSPLSSVQIQNIKNWIDRGAKNN
jgi:hypothetical protein